MRQRFKSSSSTSSAVVVKKIITGPSSSTVPPVRCPKCQFEDTKVLDTRTGKIKTSIRRRRECLSCGYRFSTLEEVLREDLYVVKRDGRREPQPQAEEAPPTAHGASAIRRVRSHGSIVVMASQERSAMAQGMGHKGWAKTVT